ncbi:hypothetical protein C3L33_19346, partial [Rhododendron williamsianum]
MEMGGQNSEPNECLPDSFEDPNFRNTGNGSIAEFEKTSFHDSLPGHCHDADICFPAVYSETDAAGGSSKWTFPLEGRTTQSIAYPNHNALVFPQSQIASTEVLNQNMGSSEDRRDLLASQVEAYPEGHVSESSNLTFPACSDAPVATILHTMSTIPHTIPHLTGGSSELMFQQKNQSTQFAAYPNPNGLVDPQPQMAPTQKINHLSRKDHKASLCFGLVILRWWRRRRENCRFSSEMEGTTTVVVFDFDHTMIEDNSDTWVVEQMGLTPLFDQLRPGRPPDQHGEKNSSPTCKTLSTNGQTEMENEFVGHLEETNEFLLDFVEAPNVSTEKSMSRFSAYPNSDGPVVPHPHMASTQILGENMESLGDLRNLFASLEEPLLQGHVSGSMWTVPPCLDQAPSRLMPTIAHTMGSSDDLRNLLSLVGEPFSTGHVSGSIDWTVPPCLDQAPSQLMPTIAHTTESSDDLRNLLPLVGEPFLAGHVSGSINRTVPPCSVPAPSQPMPTIAHTMGNSDDLRNLLALVEEPFPARQAFGSVSWTVVV